MSDRLSGRALAAALGVDEKAVRKAVEIGRIKRGADYKFDLADARERWVRSTEPNRSKVRRAGPHQGPQSAPSADRPQVDVDTLWSIVAELPALAAWAVALQGVGLQPAHDVAADMVLDIGGNLTFRGFAEPPIAFEAIDWHRLAEEADLPFIDPVALRAEWDRRRLAPE